MNMKILTLTALLLSTTNGFSQSLKDQYSRQYSQGGLTGTRVIAVMEECGFKPFKVTTDVLKFKTVVLQLSANAYKQFDIDTWSLCTNKHDDYFTLYNMYYKKISLEYYNANCNELMTLMLIDGVAYANKRQQ